jgi:hypothetical protein
VKWPALLFDHLVSVVVADLVPYAVCTQRRLSVNRAEAGQPIASDFIINYPDNILITIIFNILTDEEHSLK